MAVLHLAGEGTAVINPSPLILLFLGKLSPIHHAKGAIKTSSCWEYPSQQFGWVSKASCGRIKSPLFLENGDSSCLVVPVILRPLLSFLRNHLRPPAPVTPATQCVLRMRPLSARVPLDHPVISWHLTCLRPQSSLHPTPLNTHTTGTCLDSPETDTNGWALCSVCVWLCCSSAAPVDDCVHT